MNSDSKLTEIQQYVAAAVPIVTEENKNHFCDTFRTDCLPMGLPDYGSYWDGLTTGTLKFNMDHNLIQLSQTKAFLHDGIMKDTDVLHDSLQVLRITMKKTGESNRYIDVSDRSSRYFTPLKTGEPDTRRLFLVIPGERVGFEVDILVLPGRVNLNTGELRIEAFDTCNSEGWSFDGFVLKSYRTNTRIPDNA